MSFMALLTQKEMDEQAVSDSSIVYVYDLLFSILKSAELHPSGPVLVAATRLFSIEDMTIAVKLMEQEIIRRGGKIENQCLSVH